MVPCSAKVCLLHCSAGINSDLIAEEESRLRRARQNENGFIAINQNLFSYI